MAREPIKVTHKPDRALQKAEFLRLITTGCSQIDACRQTGIPPSQLVQRLLLASMRAGEGER